VIVERCGGGDPDTPAPETGMDPETALAPRLARLPTATFGGYEVPIANTPVSRLLGLAILERERAGTGLLIPRCRSIHTFGMRFALEVIFLDGEGRPFRRRVGVGPGRFLFDRRADSILELVQGPGAILRGKGGEADVPSDSQTAWFPNETR
jgi:uncharacterized membrane protein (UPF0127 family)